MQPVVFFDAIETVFSLAPLDRKLEECGLPPLSGATLFAQILRDAFAVSATGRFISFPEMARANLEVMLATHQDSVIAAPAGADPIEHILSAFSELPAHPDAKAAFEIVKNQGFAVCLLTNGPAEGTRKLVAKAGLEELVDNVISVEDFQQWKPAPELYRQAARSRGLVVSDDEIETAVLIAAHAWDINGAVAAGMKGVWVRRQDAVYHSAMTPALARESSLDAAAQAALRAL